MQSYHLKNISLLLSLKPLHIKVPRIPYPPHWKAGQRVSKPPQSLGDRIRKHRLELHWLQADLAKAMGVRVVSVSNWERGACLPSRRMMKKLQGFFDYAPRPVPEHPTAGLCGWECEMHKANGQLCLFERFCKQRNYGDLEQQVTGQELPLAVKHTHAPVFRHNQQRMRAAS
jgi:transcriptional regulator with XRE-family HTH domain